MHTERYMFLRNELIRLHSLFSQRTFIVSIPMSSFMTLKQLSNAKENPPIQGFDSLLVPVERPFTVEFLLSAIKIMDDQINIGFRYPREHIPLIYDSIQLWIQYWLEIKINASYLRTPDIKELELIEKFARFLFGPYAHYYHEKVNNTMNLPAGKEATLIDLFRGKMMYGDNFGEAISYVSHLDHYKSSIGYTDYSNGNDSALDFLRGSGFGGGF